MPKIQYSTNIVLIKSYKDYIVVMLMRKKCHW